LSPLLSDEEKERLAKAEGHWPLYPVTLVELADKHPLALPSHHGATQVSGLPAAVQKDMKNHFGKAGKKDKKDEGKGGKKAVVSLDNFLKNVPVASRLEQL